MKDYIVGCWITRPHASRERSSGGLDLVQVQRGTYRQTLLHLQLLLQDWEDLISRVFTAIPVAFEGARTTWTSLLSDF